MKTRCVSSEQKAVSREQCPIGLGLTSMFKNCVAELIDMCSTLSFWCLQKLPPLLEFWEIFMPESGNERCCLHLPVVICIVSRPHFCILSSTSNLGHQSHRDIFADSFQHFR